MKKCILLTIILVIIITIFSMLFINTNVNAAEEKNILFIGNSKTYYNNLPRKVYNLARLDGSADIPNLNYAVVTKGGKTLEWFYEERATYKTTLLSNKWDYVVLQEQTGNALNDSNLDKFKDGANSLITYLKQNNVIDQNTTIIYHATWVKAKESSSATSTYDISKLKEDQDKTNEHYRAVRDYVEQQTNIKGKIAYSGSNFISAMENLNMKKSDLYLVNESGASAQHPTNAGSYLAACTIYETMFDSQVKDFTGDGTANPYDNVLDNTYKGSVSDADAGDTGTIDKEVIQKLQYISRRFVDITPPVISDVTVSNQQWTNSAVTLSFKASDNIYRATVNGQTVQNNGGTYSFSVSSNGVYNIETVDLVGHKSTNTKGISNIDTTFPTNLAPTATSTTNSITITLSQTDAASGLNGNKTLYRITDSNGSAGNWQTSNVFTGLSQNQTYYIQTQVTDNAGNTQNSNIGNIKTQAIPDLTSTNTKFELSNNNWTKDNVTVKITTTVTGFQLQTKVGANGTWSNEITQELIENDTIYARLTDGTNIGNQISTEISNIDKAAPTNTAPTVTSTTNSITVLSQQKDEASGIDETKTKYRLTDSNGSTGEWQTSNIFEGLIFNKTYHVQTQATDNVGNTSNSEIISAQTNEIPNLTNLNTRFKLSNSEWTNEAITVEVEIIDEKLLEEINAETYNLQTYVELYEIQENTKKEYQIESKRTFDSNGKIYVRLTDGTNVGNEYFYEITNIDKNPPIILGIENDSKYSEYAIITDIIDNEAGIKEITLEKDQKKVEFTIGKAIIEEGLYKITVIDNANNSTTKNFEIVKKEKEESNGNNANKNNENKNGIDNDYTTSNKIIPNAGGETYILLGIIICGIVIITSSIMLKKYKNIK